VTAQPFITASSIIRGSIIQSMRQSGGEDFLATPRLDEPDSRVPGGDKTWCPFWRAGDRRPANGQDGYSSDLEGTLLVYLLGLPKAKLAHAYITHPHTERGMSVLLVFVALAMMTILVLHSIGGKFAGILGGPLVALPMLAYIPACNWLILTDVRALRLLLRQFEVSHAPSFILAAPRHFRYYLESLIKPWFLGRYGSWLRTGQSQCRA
jgi:hypothetical protein